VKFRQGQYRDAIEYYNLAAIEYYNLALQRYNSIFEVGHITSVDTINSMALVYESQGLFDSALLHFKKAVEICIDSGSNLPNAAEACLGVGLISPSLSLQLRRGPNRY